MMVLIVPAAAAQASTTDCLQLFRSKLSLLDMDKDGGQDLFMFAITPLGTFLPAGISWTIDGGETFGQQFMYCLPGGCQTEILLTEERLKAIKAGSQVEVLFRLVGKGEVKVPVKLDGVSKAIAAVPVPPKS